MFQVSLMFLSVLVTMVTNAKRPLELCSGNDVSNDPRLEARQLDGLWHTQGILGLGSNEIFFIQDQSRSDFALAWDEATKKCTYLKFENTQVQTVTIGPFSPCFLSRQLLPDVTTLREFLVWKPNKSVMMFYRCPVQPRDDESCPETPSVRVLTKTRHFSRKDRVLVRRRLRSLGISMDSLTMVNARANRCPLPSMETFRGYGGGRNYGRYL